MGDDALSSHLGNALDASAELRRQVDIRRALADAGEAIRSQLDQRREQLAAQADALAQVSDELAEQLEAAAERSDTPRRTATATWQREVARVERYNAARLRSGERPLRLKGLPPMPPAAGPVPGGNAVRRTHPGPGARRQASKRDDAPA